MGSFFVDSGSRHAIGTVREGGGGNRVRQCLAQNQIPAYRIAAHLVLLKVRQASGEVRRATMSVMRIENPGEADRLAESIPPLVCTSFAKRHVIAQSPLSALHLLRGGGEMSA